MLTCAIPTTSSTLKAAVKSLPPVVHATEAFAAMTQELLERAALVLSFLAHGYVWGEAPVSTELPAVLAVPLYVKRNLTIIYI